MMKGKLRISTIALAATMAVAGFSNEAMARHHVHRAHFSKLIMQQQIAPDDLHPTSVALPPMRYYGGPKSPMWRG
jgi:hypothetical protein